MKKIILFFIGLSAITTSSLMAEDTTTNEDTTTEAGAENMPIVSEKKLKSAAQVTIGYAISEGKKKNSAGEVSW